MKYSFKKIFTQFLLISFIGFIYAPLVGAAGISVVKDPLDSSQYTQKQLQKTLNVQGLFTVYFSIVGSGVPPSYKYIGLQFKNVKTGTRLYESLQKGVYLDFIKNRNIALPLSQQATEDMLAKAINENFDLRYDYEKDSPLTLQELLDTMQDLRAYILSEQQTAQESYEITNAPNFAILNDAYLRLKYSYLSGSTISDEDFVRGAIQGMAAQTGDIHTVYFPPADNSDFFSELNGEFEGIGAYVEMPEPGVFNIVSVITDGPAQKAGLKAYDQVLEVNKEPITKEMTVDQVISKVKGPAGTEVELTILRNGVQSYVKVARAKVKIMQVEWKRLENNDFYIRINSFGNEVSSLFFQAVDQLKKETGIGKIIIDLRGNPGGELGEVSKMLNAFVPKGESVAYIIYRDGSENILSDGYEWYSFADKKIAILINQGSASASEIFAGTIKDYLPNNTMIVGTKSYGKGSVQTLYPYPDASSIKMTTAKWYTGKNHKGIDGLGIVPDKEIKWEKDATGQDKDNQLEYVKNLSW